MANQGVRRWRDHIDGVLGENGNPYWQIGVALFESTTNIQLKAIELRSSSNVLSPAVEASLKMLLDDECKRRVEEEIATKITANCSYHDLEFEPLEGVSRSEIERRYRKLSKLYHPDRPNGGDKERFIQIVEAKGKLVDDEEYHSLEDANLATALKILDESKARKEAAAFAAAAAERKQKKKSKKGKKKKKTTTMTKKTKSNGSFLSSSKAATDEDKVMSTETAHSTFRSMKSATTTTAPPAEARNQTDSVNSTGSLDSEVSRTTSNDLSSDSLVQAHAFAALDPLTSSMMEMEESYRGEPLSAKSNPSEDLDAKPSAISSPIIQVQDEDAKLRPSRPQRNVGIKKYCGTDSDSNDDDQSLSSCSDSDSNDETIAAKPKRKSKAKQISRQAKNECVAVLERKINEITYYTMTDANDNKVRLDTKFINNDGEDLTFNEEEFTNAGKEVPDEQLLATVKAIQPLKKYLRVGFNKQGKKMEGSDESIIDHLCALLKPIAGLGTPFQKDDKQIKKLFLASMPRVRGVYVAGDNKGLERGTRHKLQTIAEHNHEQPHLGLNSMVDNFDEFSADVISLVRDGRVDVPRRMGVKQARDYVEKLLVGSTDGIFDAEDAKLIMRSKIHDYLLLCANSAVTDSLDANNEIARQDAENVCMASGLNVFSTSHGTAMTLIDGVQIPVLYLEGDEFSTRRYGCLALLPAGEYILPSCIGALIMKYEKGTWTEDDYNEIGPNVRLTLDGTYLVDIFNCIVLRVYTSSAELESVDPRGIGSGGYFYDSLVSLGSDMFIGQYKRPKVSDQDGLSTFRYTLRSPQGKYGRKKFTVHQLIEFMKRQLGFDSRGPITGHLIKQIGFPGQTPEQVFPVIGKNEGKEWDERIPFISHEEQNEVGDCEHAVHRNKLEHNGAVFVRGTNHSHNSRIVTTQSHEVNGTGDHNFAHVRIAYSSNSTGTSRDVSRYNGRHKSKGKRRRTT